MREYRERIKSSIFALADLCEPGEIAVLPLDCELIADVLSKDMPDITEFDVRMALKELRDDGKINIRDDSFYFVKE